MATPDVPHAIASDPAAPPSERYDAQAEIGRSIRGDATGLMNTLFGTEDIRPVIAQLEMQLEEQDMLKARSGVQFPGRMGPVPTSGPRSVMLDDLQLTATGDYFEKPATLGLEGLRMMVEQTPILNSIVLTRIRQVARFTQPSEDGGLGFEIRHVDRTHKMTDEDRKAAGLLTRFISNCGWEFNPRARIKLGRDNFTQFMSKSIRDSLSMDSAPIETEMKRNRALGIDGFYAVDGSTIRLCTERGYEGNDKIFAVQLVQGRVTAAYDYDQLVYQVRNPRTDVRLSGYGMGEPELLLRIVTGFLNAMTYNLKGLDENAIPKGLLHLTGDYSSEDLGAFKRMWAMTTKGVSNTFNLPVMVSKNQESKASFERFGIDFNEMYFAKWMTFLVAIACAIYGMSPDEINFESFAASKSSLSGDDTAEKLAESKDRGLRPFMAHYETQMSDFIISEFTDQFVFRWAGLEAEDQAQKWERQKLCLSLDEMRAIDGLDPYPVAELADAPMNPSLLTAWTQMKQAAAQPEQPQGDFGDPDSAPKFSGGPDAGGEQDASGDEPPGAAAAAGEPDASEPGQGGPDFGKPKGGDFGKALTASAIYAIEGADV